MGFGGLSGIAGGFFTGDTKISEDYKRTYKRADKDYNGYARQLTDSALASLNERDQFYNNQLNGGVLPQELKDAFARRRGVLSDDEMRRRRQFSTMLAQRRAQTGGQLSEAAAMEFQTENERDQMEGRRAAEADISGREGEMILTETNNLYNRIDEIRKMRLGVGQAERDRAANLLISTLGGRQNALKQASEETRAWVSTMMGGAGSWGGMAGGGVSK